MMTTPVTGKRSAEEEMGLLDKAGPFGRALVEAARKRPDIVAVSADLAKYTDLGAFAGLFPDRFVEVGMAEQNLMAVAGGLAQSGLTVVASSFAAFLSRRAVDFMVMQVALPRANVKVIAGVPGISASFGPSHCSIEDLAIMRAIPHMVVIDPGDPIEAAEALTWALDYKGPVYLRLPFNRANTARPEGQVLPTFTCGRADVLREGRDLTIVATGDRVQGALRVAAALEPYGVSAAVLRATSVKPFDQETVAGWAARTMRVVTMENHSVHGGLFSQVCEIVASRGLGAKVIGNGVRDTFPPFGSPAHVPVAMGMTDDEVLAQARAFLGVA